MAKSYRTVNDVAKSHRTVNDKELIGEEDSLCYDSFVFGLQACLVRSDSRYIRQDNLSPGRFSTVSKEVKVLEEKKLSRADYKQQKLSEQKKARKNEGLTNLRAIADLIRVWDFIEGKVEGFIGFLKEYFDDFYL